MLRPVVLLLLPAFLLTGAVAAQPERTAALEKAKTKFEKDIAKCEETFLAGLDKTMVKALSKNDKPLHDKLTYERDQFVKFRTVPTAYPADTYLKQRNQAINALQAAYNPVITGLTKSKKLAEAAAIEDELCELLKSSRGYGLAIPDLSTKPIFLIENKALGLVIDTLNRTPGSEDLILTTKVVGKRKSSQCWQFEREEKGYVIRNLATERAFHIFSGGSDPGERVITWTSDPRREIEPHSLFLVTEVRREIVIERTGDLIMTATEKKEKGVTNILVTQEKKEKDGPTPAQLWTLIEVK
jgi:hypothetical protein